MYSSYSPVKTEKTKPRKMKSEDFFGKGKKRKPDFSEQRKVKRGEE